MAAIMPGVAHRVSIFCRLIYPGRRKYAAAAEIIEHPQRISPIPDTNTDQMVDGAGKLDAQRSGHNGQFIPTTSEMTGPNRTLDAARPGRRQKQRLIKRLFDRIAFSHLTAHANGRPLDTAALIA